MRYLGIDYGEKRIGLAMGDQATKIAVPIKTVGSIEEIGRILEEEGIEAVVVGIPVGLGAEYSGQMKKKLDDFIAGLKNRFGIKVFTVDERLSSKAADSLPGGKFKASRDAIAAMIILQTFLDNLQ